jgi:hypothetical protein
MDTFAQIILVSIFITPFITIPLVWRYSSLNKVIRVLIGCLLAIPLSYIFWQISLLIIFRDGMGPV